jgi:2-polyprenyl-3-methyl-5-hydroxy-6-metoxy-1,4-benzoquinol methylase
VTAAEYFNATAPAFAASYAASRDFAARYGVWTALLADLLANRHDASLVDVGCGPGHFSLFAARLGARVVAIDPAPRMLELCSERAVAAGLAVETRCDSLPFASRPAPADLVLASSVLEYVDDIDRALLDLASLVRPDGRLVVSLPVGESVYRVYERARFKLTGHPDYLAHVRNLPTTHAARLLFARAGLEVVDRLFYGDGWAKPPRLVASLPQRLRRVLCAWVLKRA